MSANIERGLTLLLKTAVRNGGITKCSVEEVEEPLMRKVRYLDKLIDELAREKLWKRFCAHELVSAYSFSHNQVVFL